MAGTIAAGVAAANITPSVGFDTIGDYLRLVPARGVADELHAKALVLDDGTTRLAIVTADIITFSEPLLHETRARIEELTGIPGTSVLLSASHTHSSPAIDERDHPSQTYLAELAKKIAGAVFMADQAKREALIGCGSGEARVSINRWQQTPAGGVAWGPNPDGPADPDVLVMRVDDLHHTPMAILVSFASHPSILGSDNLLYSGDYAGYVQSGVEAAYGGQAAALFATGAGGDIKIAVLTDDASRFAYTTPDDCRRFGTVIADEAVRVAAAIETRPIGRIRAATIRADLPLVGLPTAAELETLIGQLQHRLADPAGPRINNARVQLAWAEATLAALRQGPLPPTMPANLQLLRLGSDIALFAVPGELFVEVGLELKRAMDLPGPFVVAYANGCIGYMPSRRAEAWGWCDADDSYRYGSQPANFSGAIEGVLLDALRSLLDQTAAS